MSLCDAQIQNYREQHEQHTRLNISCLKHRDADKQTAHNSIGSGGD